MLNRRHFLAASAAAILAPQAALAEKTKFSPDQILDNLEKAVWLSTNRSAARANYVIAAPWCPFCKQLYEEQAKLSHDIDFRFVFMDFRQFGPAVANAYFADAEDQVGLFYADPTARNGILPPATADWLNNINLVTGHLMARSFSGMVVGTNAGSGSGVGFAYPTLVQKDQSGAVSGVNGAWLHLDAIIASNAGSISGVADPMRYADLLRSAPQISSGRQVFFASEADTPYYSAPVADAPLIERIRKGGGYQGAGTLNFAGEEWIAVKAFTTTSAMQWGRRSDFFTQ